MALSRQELTRCPSCDYPLSIEEGRQCSSCGTSLIPASITQDEEPIPIVPLLITFDFFGLVGYMLIKRPLG